MMENPNPFIHMDNFNLGKLTRLKTIGNYLDINYCFDEFR
jgi:hypothetical protein